MSRIRVVVDAARNITGIVAPKKTRWIVLNASPFPVTVEGSDFSHVVDLPPSAMRSDLVPVTNADAGFVDLIAERGDAFEDPA